MHRILCIALLLTISVLAAQEGVSLPRFASRTGNDCRSCHVNPSGGMMRQPFGVQYGRENLPVEEWSKGFDTGEFNNVIANFLGVGADFRTLYFARSIPDTASPGRASHRDAFFQMQGDLYLNFHLAKHVDLFLNKGLYSGFEAFGLVSIAPAHSYLKIGKFLPNFGTRLDDHTAYIRTYTGFSPELGRPELTGFEVGVAPGSFSVSGGFYNSSDGFGASESSTKAFLGRAEGRFKLSEGLHLSLGADIFSRGAGGGDRTNLYGGFGALSIGGFTIFGEADIIRTGETRGLVAYAEADYMVVQGIDLKVAYDFYDPDTDQMSGAFSRYSFGLEFFPLPGVELRPLYRINHETPVDLKNNEFDLVLHFYL